jgi:SCF-associated factor 1
MPDPIASHVVTTLCSESAATAVMPSISDSPIDLLLDNLLPCIPVKDLLHLAQTSRFFADLVADDTLWKRKLQADFNFDGAGTARTSGWKFIYKGLLKPSVFLWGSVNVCSLLLMHL